MLISNWWMKHHHITIKLKSYWIYFCIFLSSVTAINRFDGCKFPDQWSGSWFQKGVSNSIRIANDNISEKGLCINRSGDKYLIFNSTDNCFRCMVIYEKHQNVLQYKETFCNPSQGKRRKDLHSACNQFNGDEPLYSLFRTGTLPVACPFKGPFKFTYSRGHGECKEPQSSIISCTDEMHLLLNFQACTDVQGSESRVETLECYATWKVGSYQYMVGKLYYPSAKSDEDHFRCFQFERHNDSYIIVAQSGDATCDGIELPSEGSRIMKLTKTAQVETNCKFPYWLLSYRYLQSLDLTTLYDFVGPSTLDIINRELTLISQCNCYEEKISTDYYAELILRSTSKCNTGYVCLRVFRKSDGIVEMQMGELVKYYGDACLVHPKNYVNSYKTLITLEPDLIQCPFDGVYLLNTLDERHVLKSLGSQKDLDICPQSSLKSNCDYSHQMSITTSCKSAVIRNYHCLGSWQENGTNYQIIKSKEEDGVRYCLSYNEIKSENNVEIKYIQMKVNSVNCRGDMTSQNYDTVHLELIKKGTCQSTGSSETYLPLSQNRLLLNFPINIFLIMVINLYKLF